ncbi:MAG TPA: dual specificity protein phosphatase family protein [Polyangiaceae bacterium]|nr:dual specificity protein phosphatase family protein [Polyangiaceae bacterium]
MAFPAQALAVSASLLSAGLLSAGCTTAAKSPVEPRTPAVEVASADSPAKPTGSPRPDRWAKPRTAPGLPNLHRVSETFWRSAQPSAEGMAELPQLGVRTVINLRSLHSDRDEIGQLPLQYEHIKMKAWHAEDEDIVRFLQVVTDPERQPVLVHCQHGADRTGVATAAYRIAVQGWSKDEAIAEMTQGGFGFHTIWANLVRYVRQLDVERIRREAGIPAPTAQ